MAITSEEMLEQARATVPEKSPAQIKAEVKGVLFADVRESDEWEQGHIAGAVHLPRGFLEFFADPQSPNAKPEVTAHLGEPIVVYCSAGRRSLLAAKTLQALGYRDVVSLKGGYKAWKSEE